MAEKVASVHLKSQLNSQIVFLQIEKRNGKCSRRLLPQALDSELPADTMCTCPFKILCRAQFSNALTGVIYGSTHLEVGKY